MPRQRRIDFPDFSKVQIDARGLMRKLPSLLGNTAVNFYKDSWNREGYIDKRFSRWKPRQRTEGKPRRTLVKTGRLRRSIRYRTLSNTITIYSDVPYAQVHNEGGKVIARQRVRQHTRRTRRGSTTVRAHHRNVNFTMPQRQFMDIPGQPISALLEKRLVALTARAIDQVFRKL